MEKTSPRLCLPSQVQRLNFGVWLRGCGAARCQHSREEFPTWGRVRLGHPHGERGFFAPTCLFFKVCLKRGRRGGELCPVFRPSEGLGLLPVRSTRPDADFTGDICADEEPPPLN